MCSPGARAAGGAQFPPQGTDRFWGTAGERLPSSAGARGRGTGRNSQSVQLPFLPPLLFHSPSVPQPRTPRAPAARAVNIKTGFVSASKGGVAPAPRPCRGPQPSPAAAAASPKAAGGWHGHGGFLGRLARSSGGLGLGGDRLSISLPPPTLAGFRVSVKRGYIALTPQPSVGSGRASSGLELNPSAKVTENGKRKKKGSSAPPARWRSSVEPPRKVLHPKAERGCAPKRCHGLR